MSDELTVIAESSKTPEGKKFWVAMKVIQVFFRQSVEVIFALWIGLTGGEEANLCEPGDPKERLAFKIGLAARPLGEFALQALITAAEAALMGALSGKKK